MAKTKKKNWLAILGILSISATSVAGTCTSLYFGYKNYEQSSDFDKSYNLRIELNENQTEDPWKQTPIHDYNEISEKVKNSASQYLKYYSQKNKTDYSVYSEVIEDEKFPQSYKTYLNVTVPNEKIKSTIDDDLKVDKDTSAIYYEFFSTPKISIIYSDGLETADQPRYYEFSQEFLTNTTWNDISINKDNSAEIDIRLNNAFKDKGLEHIKEKFKPVKDDDNSYRPFMYVFKDQQGLINRMRYITSLDFKDDAYQLLDDSEKTFWQDTQGFGWDKTDFTSLKVKDPDSSFNDQSSTTKTLDYGQVLVPTRINNSLVSLIEDITPPEAGKPIIHTGNLKYEFLKKYVLGIIYQDKATPKPSNEDPVDTFSSFYNFFPEKDPNDSKKDSDFQWMIIKQSDPSGSKPSKFENQLFFDGITKNKLDLPIKAINRISVEDNVIHGSNIQTIKPSFDNNFFGITSIEGALIAIATIVLVLGIIVSVLYRIPGLISFLLVLLTISLAFLTLSMVGYLISATLVCGLFVGFLVGMLIIVNGFERTKKEMSVGFTTMVSIKKAFFKSFMPIIDICIVALFCGIGFVYIGSAQFLSLGVLMILISFLSFLIVFFGQFSILFLLFKNYQIGLENNKLFVRTQKTTISEQVTTFETTFKQKSTKTPFDLFSKPLGIALAIVLPSLIIVGLLVMYLFGNQNSFAFSGGTRILIDDNFIQNNFGGNIQTFISLLTGKWTSTGLNGSYWIINSQEVLTHKEILNILKTAGFTPTANQIFVQQAIPNGFEILSNATLIMLFSIAGLLTAYALIRFGWISMIPIFLGTIAASGLTLLIFFACQIYIDQSIISAVSIGFVINSLFIFNLLANIANKSARKEKGDINSLKTVFNIQVWGSKFFFGIVMLFITCSLIAVGTLISTSIISFVLIILVTTILSVFVCYLIVPQLYIVFKSIQNKYIRRVIKIESRQEVFDKIDEQLIPGINVEAPQ